MLYDGDTFEFKGRTFKFETRHDEGHEAPWDWADGHGPVSEWTARDKRPGERLLHSDRRSHRYYDFQEAVKIARRDGWDAAPLGEGTAGQRAARAAEADFEYLRRWCNDQWSYVGVVVTLLDSDDEETDETESLWGIESDAREYLEETARELADEICARVDAALACSMISERPDMYPQA